MIIRKAYKFRLEPSADQCARLAVLCGHARFIFNHGLRHCLSELEQGKRCPSAYDLNKLIPQWKTDPELAWLKDGNAVTYQQKLADLGEAWKRYFDKSLVAEKPVFKKKSKGKDSIRFVQFDKYCQLEGKRIKLPSKLGWMKFRKSQNIVGTIKNCTISKNANQWYISFQVEQEIGEPVHASSSAIGCDMGIAKFLTLSDGTFIKPVNSFKKHQSKLAKLQRQLAKKTKFSNNWKKHNRKITKLHSKIANCRNDFLSKTSTTLTNNHSMIVIEDLKVSNMSRSARGNSEEHGKNVKQKSGLNRSILDQGWGNFRTMLEYKQAWRGGLVVAVPAHHTSQTCYECGHVSKDNRKTQASFVCVQCGFSANADHVGAMNILARGHRVLACGESALADSVKQEPPFN